MDHAARLLETLAATLAQAGDMLLELRALVGGSTREPKPVVVGSGLRARGLRGLRDIVEAPPLPTVVAPAPATDSRRGNWKLYDVDGDQLTAADLAVRAGCSLRAMRKRLEHGRPAADAVAMGDKAVRPPRPRHTFELAGQLLTMPELAARAGCSEVAMYQRIHIQKLTPEAAVAAGANMKRSAKAPKPAKPPRDAGVAPPAPPTRAQSVFEVADQQRRKVEPPKLDSKAEVIVPADVKRTVYQRAEPAPVPSTFGRIGQYEASGSAIERSMRGSR